MGQLVVSPSPHTRSSVSTPSLMYGVIAALLPALAVSIYYFGIGALIVTLTSVASCVLFEYLIQKFLLKQQPTLSDGSAILTGLLLAFNLFSGTMYSFDESNGYHRQPGYVLTNLCLVLMLLADADLTLRLAPGETPRLVYCPGLSSELLSGTAAGTVKVLLNGKTLAEIPVVWGGN